MAKIRCAYFALASLLGGCGSGQDPSEPGSDGVSSSTGGGSTGDGDGDGNPMSSGGAGTSGGAGNSGGTSSGGVATGSGGMPVGPVATTGRIVDLRFEGDLDGEVGTEVDGVGTGTIDFETGFDGSTLRLTSGEKSFVSLGSPESLALDETRNFTVQVWVRTTLDASGRAVLMSNSDLSEAQSPIHANHGLVKLNKGWSFYLREGTWGFNVGDSYQNFMYEPFAGTQIANDGSWHQIVFSHDVDEESVRIYFDGRKRAIINIHELGRGFGTDLPTNIGVDGRGAGSHYDAFEGQLDNVVVWDHTLTDEEVTGLYRSYAEVEVPVWTRKNPDKIVAIAWNIWHGGTHFTKDADGWDGAERVAEIIQELDADFVMMQETYGAGGKIASILDYELMLAGSCWSATWGSNISVMSRYPMKRGYMTNELPEYNGGALVQITEEQDLLVFSNWYSRDRPQQIGQVLSGWTALMDDADNIPILWGGDFNSPSHLDGDSGSHSMQMTDAGFTDSFRELNDAENRIDYLYYLGNKLTATFSDMKRNSDFERYPSDHPIVYTEFQPTFALD